MSLLFNMQSRLVITFLPRSKHLLISYTVDGEVVVTVGGLISGAVFDSARFVFISENDIFGRLKRDRKSTRLNSSHAT